MLGGFFYGLFVSKYAYGTKEVGSEHANYDRRRC